jgi:hypothetical protein
LSKTLNRFALEKKERHCLSFDSDLGFFVKDFSLSFLTQQECAKLCEIFVARNAFAVEKTLLLYACFAWKHNGNSKSFWNHIF